MQIKILTVPIYGGEAMEEVLNVFLRSHRVLQVEQRLVETPGGAAWSFCIRYFGEADVLARGEERDYRKELGDEAFERFKALRTRRNELAKELGLKPFQLFTNDEMAQMARLGEITAEGMKSIRGIGDGKVSKYGQYFIGFKFPGKDEKSQPPAASDSGAG